MIKEADLKDEERQPCEIWTRVMGVLSASFGIQPR